MKKMFYIAVIMMVILFTCPGCGSFQGEYRTITVKSKLCAYKLEYSRYYEKNGPITDLTNKIPGTYLNLVAPEIKDIRKFPDPDTGKMKTVTGYYSPASITIDVFDTVSKDSDDLRTAADYINDGLRREAKWPNFKLLERIPVNVSGIQTEQITYFVDAFMQEGLDYNIIIFFDNNGLIWNIEANCDSDMAERIQADFDHIIQTFQILE